MCASRRVARIAAHPLEWEPGTEAGYHPSSGWKILGAVVEPAARFTQSVPAMPRTSTLPADRPAAVPAQPTATLDDEHGATLRARGDRRDGRAALPAPRAE